MKFTMKNLKKVSKYGIYKSGDEKQKTPLFKGSLVSSRKIINYEQLRTSITSPLQKNPRLLCT